MDVRTGNERAVNSWVAGAGNAHRSAAGLCRAVANRFEVNLRSSASSTEPRITALPSKFRRKNSVFALLGAGEQIGKRVGRNVL